MPDNQFRCADSAVLTILKTSEEVNQLKDVDTILDKILYESRRFANADAGSIFLVEKDSLIFSYVQNDTLFKGESANAALYHNFAIPISEKSIVGYAAKTRGNLAIDDAYELDPTLPFAFNKSFDQKSGYRTTSMLTIPLIAQESRLVGVMQLINARNEAGAVGPFTDEAKTYIPLFCNNASVAIERGIMNRELILRMMQMAELRDPTETGAHVQRVGAYCAEIYGTWAARRKHSAKDIKRTRDNLRLAAMLHDVGKVGISDNILKKPGKLTDEEFEAVKWHTVWGARLFKNQTSGLDAMSSDIARCHHEKWAGGGYPGTVLPDLWSPEASMGASLSGEAIPLAARICAVADVYDALASPRSYKDPFPDEKCLAILEKDAGTHFDPEIVEIFIEIFDVIKAIRDKFKETAHV
ncbi:MAG: HD domain-containing protein [Pseudodesulfovibrio sp.]|uniref:Metal-dependent phosphohydrolase HD sub domain protein n=1 Tax=Pseudodesulfovibrio aespoeensis (strain ATCC 700646 / DSM 10631 / Aspo-2) TaxID=643562 RepID=E6VTX3_PSEA9|nr:MULTISPECIES: HD domain-containing phosphohydrolase [Pseudodesulfovibrio]MBU4191620.1 HD domain-containing protein [Pseudomonadota bacterium]ADU61065.1 metal-dependent phosphohydrolase HD sub domain protein [Pseudodesulfovibrio aespoeensis Aspo-2]MBU4244084.1 HD domain-containing protein [Pseudomonadota bacterium]MBU4380131.1 HD domain-containing protein [Pseudomonadota bacterium]MBU4476399.1 HD domain-containing protein [Pseudomonadota bacterium]